jgi:uncharacterized protein
MSGIGEFSVASLAELHEDRWTAPFWQAAREHLLLCAQCGQCGTFRMPPSQLCFKCRSDIIVWKELAGTGTVYSYTVVRHGVTPELKAQVPYVIALVSLDGAPGTRLVANIWSVLPEEAAIGLKVQVAWDDIDDRTTIPRFTLAQP